MSIVSLKSKTRNGIIWNAIEKFFVHGIQFIISIVLARLLLPVDYGLIGMLAVFMAISQSFVDSGMGSGLIQKQNRTRKDYSTVFVFNFFTSSFFYLLLFFSAPLISNFYDIPLLIPITRVLGLNLIINSLTLVQYTRLTIALDFKTLAKTKIISTIISGSFAIYFAFIGFGVWSLVIRQILKSVSMTVLLWYISKWKPSVHFSKQSFKELFGYGSKILLSSIYGQVFNNIYNITIGKYYSAKELGYYNQANMLAGTATDTISGILQHVTFPVLASLQNDRQRMISAYKRVLKTTAFFIFPAMTVLSVLAEPFVLSVLGDKWKFTIPLLQILSFAKLLYPLSSLNLSLLNANGRSDIFLKVNLTKTPVMILILIITIPIGIKAMVIGYVVTSFIEFIISSFMPGKLWNYGPISQLKDLYPIFIIALTTASLVYLSIIYIDYNLLKLILGGITALITYFLLSYLFKIEELKEVVSLLKNRK